MPRSAPGPVIGLPSTRTRPLECGNWGWSPAIIRITVDLPQPDGPRIETNSPRPGWSSIVNETSRIAVKSPNRLVTLSNITTGGLSAGAGASGFMPPVTTGAGRALSSLATSASNAASAAAAAAGSTGSAAFAGVVGLAGGAGTSGGSVGLSLTGSQVLPVRERPALQEPDREVDQERDRREDEQHRERVAGQAALLVGVEHPAETLADHARGLDQHEVAQREPELEPQAGDDVGQRERDQDLADDLDPAGAERLGGLDVALRHRRHRLEGIAEHERHHRDEDEHP